MSLKMPGSRLHFWQWDTGQRLEVQNQDCGEVHFCNGTTNCALVVSIRNAEGGARVVDIPDVILQTAGIFSAYLFQRRSDGTETKHEYRFRVDPRSRPSDYIYTETDVLTVERAIEKAMASGDFKGDPGPKGDPGKDGRTPVKGTDYYTEADKAEIVNAVIAALPKYNGEVVSV
jgi:hypothetical protein